jgi:hypothetical protein
MTDSVRTELGVPYNLSFKPQVSYSYALVDEATSITLRDIEKNPATQ